jgi:isopenicillin-N N-acyltransferase like protein
VTELRIVRAKGDPYARGVTVGHELRDLINESVDFYHRYLHRRGISSVELQDLLTPYLVAAETIYPDYMATMKGMSAGATVPVLELFAINAFEELEPLLESPEGGLLFLQRKEGYVRAPDPPRVRTERCSSFSIVTPTRTMLAHNEHWLAGDIGNVAVVIDIPDGNRVAVASPTVVCCLPAVGINGHGGAQGIGSLAAADDGAGAPRVLVSRSSLEALDPMDAIDRAGVPGRAGGYGHVFAFSGGRALTVETTGELIAVHDGPGAHTNHYLAPELAEIAPEASEGSSARYGRLTELIPQAICLHPEEEEGEEASAVMFSMVADLDEGRMWVAAGNPCENDYEEIDLTGVL